MGWPRAIVLATGNAGKVAEWRALLEPRGVELRVVDLPEVDENESTYRGNARLKVESAVRHTGLPALGDDSGVEVEALGGAPGLTTKRWAMDLGGWGAARALLARRALGSRAWYHCAVALAWPDGRLVEAHGVVRCRVVEARSAEDSLEPCLVPEGYEAPLSTLRAAGVHHRRQALGQLEAVLGSLREG